MTSILSLLIPAGLLAGLLQYFIEFKKLATATAETAALSAPTRESVSRVLQFITDRWELFAYMLIGIAGALLVPLLNELTPLAGIKDVPAYVNCVPSEKVPCFLNPWTKLVIVGYGIVLGYSCVRVLKGITGLLSGRVDALLQAQVKANAAAETRLAQMERQLSAMATHQGESLMTQVAENFRDDDHAADEHVTMPRAEAAAAPCTQNPPPWTGKPWRVAESLKKIRAQVDALAPGRNKASDGTIGDLNHQAGQSDHNPAILDGTMGVVTAIDITHDLNHQCDCDKLATSLETGKDSRIKYVIWNKRIMSAYAVNGTAAWTWRPYKGANPHNKHIHISVQCDKASYDSTAAWSIRVS
jgi:hypothetical protein